MTKVIAERICLHPKIDYVAAAYQFHIMSTQTIKFFGSDSDLRDLQQVLSKAGFEEVQKITIHATDAGSGNVIPTAIAFTIVIAPHFVSIIQTYLKERSKRMVTRDENGFTIRGNFTAKEFGDIAERCHRFNIEDDTYHDT